MTTTQRVQAHRHTLAAVTENVRTPIREASARRRAVREEDTQLVAQIERRRAEGERSRALFAAGLRRQAVGR